MMNAFLDKLPDCIEVAGEFFSLKTDFRTWMAFSSVLETPNAILNDVDFVYLDEVPSEEHKKEAFDRLLEFFHPSSELPRGSREKSEKVLDYAIDSQLIYAAFLEQYGLDLLAVDQNGHFLPLHWHKFLMLLSGLHNTKLNDVMAWRCWKGETKTEYGKHMAELRRAWELPTPEDKETEEALDRFNKLFD